MGIDDDLKGNGGALALGELFRGDVVEVVFAVFDYGELQRMAHLRRREADAGSGVHGLAHVVDELADSAAADFVLRKRTRELAQDGISGLDNIEEQRSSRERMRGKCTVEGARVLAGRARLLAEVAGASMA